MTPATKLEYLNEWQKCYEENEKFYQKQKEIYELSPESLAASTIWGGFAVYTKCVAKIVGDKDKWLEWYWLENGMGKKGHTAGDGAEPETVKPVKNLSDLLELIKS